MAARGVLAGVLIGVVVVFGMPIASMVLASMMSQAEADAPIEAGFLRDGVAQAGENYRGVWESDTADFPLYLHNSLVVTTLSVVGMVLSSSVVAYGLARLRWRGRNAVFFAVLASMAIPFPVVMAPLYLVFKQLGWIGTFLPLWVPAWFGGAFSIFVLRQFFLTIPREIDEAARLDGCSEIGVFWRIILPVAAPALAVVALLQFVASWNDFMQPLLFINHPDKYTLALGLQMYQSQHGGTPWNLVMAAAVMTIAPVVVVFVLAQRRIVEGVGAQGLNE